MHRAAQSEDLKKVLETQRVEGANDEVRIVGTTSDLLRTVIATSSVEAAALGVHVLL